MNEDWLLFVVGPLAVGLILASINGFIEDRRSDRQQRAEEQRREDAGLRPLPHTWARK